MIEAVFLDRDGTIGGCDHVILPGEFRLSESGRKAIALLKEKGIPVFAFTNQPGIARLEATIEAFQEELMGYHMDDAFICPHSHDMNCGCRKPGIGLLELAKEKYGLNLSKCVVIGDRWSDMLAGSTAGTQTILVKTGAGEAALTTYQHKWSKDKTLYIAADVLDAVHHLFSGE